MGCTFLYSMCFFILYFDSSELTDLSQGILESDSFRGMWPDGQENEIPQESSEKSPQGVAVPAQSPLHGDFFGVGADLNLTRSWTSGFQMTRPDIPQSSPVAAVTW